MAWKLAKSRPAQNPRPSPDSTTARTAGSALRLSPASTSPLNMAPSTAFILSGRLRRTSATPPSMAMLTRSDMAPMVLLVAGDPQHWTGHCPAHPPHHRRRTGDRCPLPRWRVPSRQLRPRRPRPRSHRTSRRCRWTASSTAPRRSRYQASAAALADAQQIARKRRRGARPAPRRRQSAHDRARDADGREETSNRRRRFGPGQPARPRGRDIRRIALPRPARRSRPRLDRCR